MRPLKRRPPSTLYKYFYSIVFPTVLGVYINTMKTNFDFNFDFYQAFKQHGYTYKHENKTVD